MIREAFLRTHPEPPIDGESAPADARPRVTEAVWWRARLEGEGADFESWLAEIEAGYPRARVADALNELFERGWRVCHLSEERRVLHAPAESHSEITGAWILLES